MYYNKLAESVEVSELTNQPYFDKFPSIRLYRGMSCSSDDIQFISFKFRDKPRNTNIRLHDAINKESVDKFGIPIRNLMFAYSIPKPTVTYGSTHIIVPKGKFTLYVNPNVFDMTNDFARSILSNFESIKDDVFNELLNKDYGAKYNTDYDFKSLFNELRKEDFNELQSPVTYIIDQVEEASIPFNNSDVADYLELDIRKTVSKHSMDMVVNNADKYVNSVIEVDSENDIDWSKNPEIMVYAPNGFYVVPEHHFDMIR